VTFRPVIPLGGYAGWRFLQRTLDTQQAAHAASAPVQRATDHFRAKIGAVRTADDLVNDRQLLTIALGAFGLDADIGNKAFIRKVLTDGTVADDALSSRLADKRYAAFARAFGFGDPGGARTALAGFVDGIVARFHAKGFAAEVGEQDNTMRLALNLGPGLDEVISDQSSKNARWYAVMGNVPLRTIFEGALGFSPAFGQIEVEQQLTQFKERAVATFGTDEIGDFADPARREKLIRLYIIRSEAASGAFLSGGSVALSLLQSGPSRTSSTLRG
jgi:hypothetical protein